MKYKKLLLVSILMFAVLIFGVSVYACTSIMVAKDASVDGSVMNTHTCDGWYDNRI